VRPWSVTWRGVARSAPRGSISGSVREMAGREAFYHPSPPQAPCASRRVFTLSTSHGKPSRPPLCSHACFATRFANTCQPGPASWPGQRLGNSSTGPGESLGRRAHGPAGRFEPLFSRRAGFQFRPTPRRHARRAAAAGELRGQLRTDHDEPIRRASTEVGQCGSTSFVLSIGTGEAKEILIPIPLGGRHSRWLWGQRCS
jgi:hypothetical protein